MKELLTSIKNSLPSPKLFSTFFAGLISILLSLPAVCAQSYHSDKQDELSDAGKIYVDSLLGREVVENYVNIKAIRNFKKAYKGIDDTQWWLLQEGGYVCRFTFKKSLNRAFYDKKGNWLYTVTGYTQDKLAREIRAMVRRAYYDYDISYINEINMPGDVTVYIIQIQDEKTLKLIRICDGEMEIIQEILKL